MAEQDPKIHPVDKESSVQNVCFLLGKATTYTGILPNESIQQVIKDDPKLLAAFIKGASEGQKNKFDEEKSK